MVGHFAANLNLLQIFSRSFIHLWCVILIKLQSQDILSHFHDSLTADLHCCILPISQLVKSLAPLNGLLISVSRELLAISDVLCAQESFSHDVRIRIFCSDFFHSANSLFNTHTYLVVSEFQTLEVGWFVFKFEMYVL